MNNRNLNVNKDWKMTSEKEIITGKAQMPEVLRGSLTR
jgi:hypothetical protein